MSEKRHRSLSIDRATHADLGQHHTIGSRAALLRAAWKHYKTCVLKLE